MPRDERINFRRNFRIYFSIIKHYKWYGLGLIFVIFFIQSVIVLEQYLFKVFIDKGTLFTNGTLPKEEFIHTLTLVAIIFITVHIIAIILKWIGVYLSSIFSASTMKELKERYFNHIMHLDHNFHVTHKTGSLISKLVRAGGAIEKLSDTFEFNFLPLIFQVGAVFFTLLYLDKQAGFILLGTMIAFITYSFIIQRKQESANIESNRADDYEKANIADFLTNIDSIKYFGKENFVSKRFEKITTRSRDAILKYWGYFRWMESGQRLILQTGTFFIILLPMLKFLNKEITLGTIAFIYTTYILMTGQLHSFVSGIRALYRSMADLQPLFAYGEIENAIKDKQGAQKLNIKHGEITFDHVGFKYHQRAIFKDFDLHIKKNEKIALVGHSGSGKSTLIKLLYRFYDVNQGAILIDGRDIREFKQESLRSELSIVPQECVLFDDTIYNNIAFSRPNARPEEVWRAIRLAQLNDLIKQLPLKENTVVGERGVKLSGGEKQRVSIARALLADKKILVLDEATSSLDSETEHEIQKALQTLMKGRTTIIIAHRLSTIMHADKIIVMKQGTIVQQGPHKQLIKQEGEYQKLWKLQKGGYIQ